MAPKRRKGNAASRTVAGTVFKPNVRTSAQAARDRLRPTSPFERLPRELRSMIFNYAFTFDGIDAYLARAELAALKDPLNDLPIVRTSTPTIFLLNRESYDDARYALRSKPLVLSHAGHDTLQLTQVISAGVLRQLTRITISKHGHDYATSAYGALGTYVGSDLWAWRYSYYLRQLAAALRPGHCLQEFRLIYEDASMQAHMEACATEEQCFVVRGVKSMLASLRGVRGVKKVEFKGVVAAFARELEQSMVLPPPKDFLDLPREIRDQIYGYCLDWNDGVAHMRRRREENASGNRVGLDKILSRTPAISTPHVLLLNRKITSEALDVLRCKPLIIDTYPVSGCWRSQKNAWGYEGTSGLGALTTYISAATLQQVRHVRIEFSPSRWGPSYHGWDEFRVAIVGVWTQRHSLQSARFRVVDEDGRACRNYAHLDTVFSYFGRVRGVRSVAVEDQDAAVVPGAAALKKVMESSKRRKLDFMSWLPELVTVVGDRPPDAQARSQSKRGGQASWSDK